MTASQIISELKRAGMPIGKVTRLDASADPNEPLGRPGQYTSKAFFSDKRLGTRDEHGLRREELEAGGSVEVFANEEDAERRAQGVQRGGGPFAEYSYRRGVVFLRLSKSLSPGRASAYARELDSLP